MSQLPANVFQFVRANKWRILIVVATALIVIAVGFFQKKEDAVIEQKGVYVVGYITKYEVTTRGQIVYYQFKFKGQVYQSSKHITLGGNIVGNRYLVQVLPSNPQQCRLLANYQFYRQTNVKQPEDGWIEIPNEAHYHEL
ncbi:hypothetical protein [Flavisolibacter tropicus]|uniref:Uncharacterized protein n=1 Tax=Flavisolibacter tropicus TaxID=1492898 RepID=A0A172TTN0_9BACT|nr:hypothetical protein [Flavisolibacter tropicus]ANE50449.1 hypothetical protein SY85_08030 [Flavisolibacter tropicus]